MNYFYNVKFSSIKDNLNEEILKNIFCSLCIVKNTFLTDISYFNSSIEFNAHIVFFEIQNTFNFSKRINFKPLTIEDFLYRTLEEVIYEYGKVLNQLICEWEKNYGLDCFNLTVFYSTDGNVITN